MCLSAHCIPENKDWLTKIIKGLNDKNVAGIYGRQKPLSYSSDFDKRDLLNLFGPEKKVQKKDTFSIMQIVLSEKNFGKNILLMIKLNILRIGFGDIL